MPGAVRFARDAHVSYGTGCIFFCEAKAPKLPERQNLEPQLKKNHRIGLRKCSRHHLIFVWPCLTTKPTSKICPLYDFDISVLIHCRAKPICSRIANCPQNLWPTTHETSLAKIDGLPVSEVWQAVPIKSVRWFSYAYIGICWGFIRFSWYKQHKSGMKWFLVGFFELGVMFNHIKCLRENKHGKHVIIFPSRFDGPSPINPHVSWFSHHVCCFSHGCPVRLLDLYNPM